MEKQRLFKMTMVDRNFLMQGLRNYAVSVQSGGGNSEAVNALIRKTMAVTGGKLFLDESEYECAVRGINNLRDAYLSAGRSSGGIDRALFKLMNSKYKRSPVR